MEQKNISHEHFEWLDVLRFMAAFFVVLSHVRNDVFQSFSELSSSGLLEKIFFLLTRLGHEAVLVFFVLSGFLVGGRLSKAVINKKTNFHGWIIDRVVRIWLPLIPAVIITYILSPNMNIFQGIGIFFGLNDVIFVTPLINSPLWSLAYEIWFYLFGFALALLLSKKGRSPLAWIILFLCFLVFQELSPHYLLCWLIGAYFYIKPTKPSPIFLTLIFTILVFCLGVLQLTKNQGYLIKGLNLKDLRFIFEIIFSVCIGYLLPILKQLPSIRISQVIGPLSNFSYTLYVVHYPLLKIVSLNFVQKSSIVDGKSILIFISLVLILNIASFFIYKLFEFHTLNVKKFIKKKLSIN